MTKIPYGATPHDWQFLVDSGLTADLLPVVSDPNAPISPNSNMKQLGKTPSLFNSAGQVVGIAQWTSKKSTIEEVEKWKANSQYGICVQTRQVRALDIDVEDRAKAEEIVRAIEGALGYQLPIRYREGSGKCLLAFRLEGDYRKRVLKTEGGMVEFLADGQQFIAFGTHPSGSRYGWEFPYGQGFSQPTGADFEKVWDTLVVLFGTEAPSEAGLRRAQGVTQFKADAVVDYLELFGYAKGYGPEGQVFIDCPFKAEHTGDSGISATAYFPAGGRGYQQGHFKCLHAHCAKRTDVEFLDGLDYRSAQFQALPVPSGDDKAPVDKEWPRLERDKSGYILPNIYNVTAVLGRPDVCGEHIRLDSFKEEMMTAPLGNPAGWRHWRDTDYSRLRLTLETNGLQLGFKPIGRELMRDSVKLVAEQNSFDSGIEWTKSLVWDGKPRVKTFLSDYLSAANDDYTQAVGLYMWSALAGRVVKPGVKADMVPVLVGTQGNGKTSTVEKIAPSEEFFGSISLKDRDADLSRRIKGKLIIELAELNGLKTREQESIKEFVTRRHENWVPKYQEAAVTYPRRCLFIGTTNDVEFLTDTTGNRRWLPVVCGSVDIEGLERDRLQLWAEGLELFRKHGVMWKDAQKLAEGVHDKHRAGDIWADLISEWLETPCDVGGQTPMSREFLTTMDVMRGALNLDTRSVKKHDEMRVASILREMGFESARERIGGKPVRKWKLK